MHSGIHITLSLQPLTLLLLQLMSGVLVLPYGYHLLTQSGSQELLSQKLQISTPPLPLLAITFGMCGHAAFKILSLASRIVSFIPFFICPWRILPTYLPQYLLL